MNDSLEFNPGPWIKQVFEDFNRTLPPSQQMLFIQMAEKSLLTLEKWRSYYVTPKVPLQAENKDVANTKP
jgi:hypothetical protein